MKIFGGDGKGTSREVGKGDNYPIRFSHRIWMNYVNCPSGPKIREKPRICGAFSSLINPLEQKNKTPCASVGLHGAYLNALLLAIDELPVCVGVGVAGVCLGGQVVGLHGARVPADDAHVEPTLLGFAVLKKEGRKKNVRMECIIL